MKKNKEKNKDKSDREDLKGKKNVNSRSWILRGTLIGIVIIVIIIIFASVFAPRTKKLYVQNIITTEQYLNSSSNSGQTLDSLKNDLILETSTNSYLTITNQQLQEAEVSTYLIYGGNKTTYLVYLPSTSIGRIDFLFTIYYDSSGPTSLYVGNNATNQIPLTSSSSTASAPTSGYSDTYSLFQKLLTNNSIEATTSSSSGEKDSSNSNNSGSSNDSSSSGSTTTSPTSNGTSTSVIDSLISYYQTQQNYSYANFLQYVYLNTPITNYASSSFNWGILANYIYVIILIAFFVIMGYAMMRGGVGGAGGDIFSMGKSQAKIASSNVRFSDVGGIGEEKYELEEIVDFLKQPKKYASMGARVPKGVILYGPPGTGKTLLAKAVAGEANVPFLETSGSSFEDMLVGVGAKRVRDLFQRAKKSAPAIIFIDEIDSVAGKRSNNRVGDSGLANQTINELLSQMDGFNTASGVIVIAATNRLDMLDEAILRPGRFDRQIPVNLPDIDERVQILKIHSRNKNISAKVSLEDVARRTPGFSGAQLENVLNEAALLAVRHNSNVINLGDIDEAIDRVIGGPAKHNRKVSFEEKKQIAFHEAGHALVGLNVEGADIVEKITIIPRGNAAGYTVQTPAIQELQIQKKSDLLGLIASTLGGRASEEIIFGVNSISTGASNDLYKATNIARAMVTQLGMTDVGMMQYIPSEGEKNPYRNDYSEKTAEAIDRKINDILDERYSFAKDILTKNRRELELIVESLLILETIDRKQIHYIHIEKKLPVEVIDKILYLIKTNQLDESYLFEEEKKEFLANHNNSNNQSNDENSSNNTDEQEKR